MAVLWRDKHHRNRPLHAMGIWVEKIITKNKLISRRHFFSALDPCIHYIIDVNHVFLWNFYNIYNDSKLLKFKQKMGKKVRNTGIFFNRASFYHSRFDTYSESLT